MAASLKVPLQIAKKKNRAWQAPGHTQLPISFALPFYLSAPGRYVHRIRRGEQYIRHGKYSHTAFSMWCRLHGFLGRNHPHARIFAEAPENEIFCATCEGRAIGAGLDGSHILNGRLVRFSPRK